ncbi:MAG: methyltransferase domain-containing protein [Candidatus Nanopelagicales bacterium]|nr:methyltransferase domain-containing protein [Candidatus Nanopelagicales bacterium]MDZ4249925.1 methyltransferase domain-containing protein [Candidatus Nanopelagicales bacterium]
MDHSHDESIAAIYDSSATTYDASRDEFDLTEVLRDFRARLPASGNLLDLGCGAGRPVALEFASAGWHVTGVDRSRAMLDLAAKFVPGMEVIHADMRSVRFPDQSFDAIVAIYALFHIPWTDHPALFANMRAWLRPGGTALFTYATRAYTGHDRFNGTKEFMGQQLFYSHTTPEELRAQLDAAGLDVVDAQDRTIAGETFLWVTVTPRST